MSESKKLNLIKKLTEEKLEIGQKCLFYPIFETFDELNDILSNFNSDNYTTFLYLNRDRVYTVLYNKNEILNIKRENINFTSLKSLFYFSLVINNNKDIINFSYDNILLDEVNRYINQEKNNNLKKLILLIIYKILYENFNQINFTETSTKSDENAKIIEEIKNKINEQIQIQEEFELNLKENEDDLEKIYDHIIISSTKKFEEKNGIYVEEVLKEIDMENIELTSKMFEKLKKEFEKENLNDYKITKYEDLFVKKIINFHYIMFKYVFKNDIYIYNIEFFLSSRNNIRNIYHEDKSKLNSLASNNSKDEENNFNEKIYFVVKRLLGSEYYFIQTTQVIQDYLPKLEVVLDYYKKFHKKEEQIEELEEIMRKGDKSKIEKYLNEYEEAKEKNERYDIIKYIYFPDDSNPINEKSIIEYYDKWKKGIENCIHDKRMNKMKDKKKLYDYFTNEKNKENILKIFKKEEIDLFYQNYYLITLIEPYLKNYFFESKKEEIDSINDNKNINIKEYLKGFDLAQVRKKNILYEFISKVFDINKETKTEKEVKTKTEKIEKMLESKKLIDDDKIKIRLFKYINNESKLKNLHEILKPDSYEFLLEQKKEAMNIILQYYNSFFPESKATIIESIERGEIEDDNFEDYTEAKKKNLRKEIIYSLLDDKNNKREKEINKALNSWENIEAAINNKQFEKIQINEINKIIKFFEDKDNENNKFIKEIFNNEIIDEFVQFKDFQQKKENEKSKIDNSLNIYENSSTTSSTTYKKRKKKNKRGKPKEQKNIINNELDIQFSQTINSEKTTITTTITQEEKKSEEDKEYKSKNKEDIIIEEFLQKNLRITLLLENKKIDIKKITSNDIYFLTENQFEKCMEYYSKEKDSNKKKVFDFLEDFKERLISEYNNNYPVVLELSIIKENNDFNCLYEFFPPCKNLEEEKKSFKDFAIANYSITDGFEYLIDEINDKDKYSNIKIKKNINKKIEVPSEQSIEPTNSQNNISNNEPDITGFVSRIGNEIKEYYKEKANEYEILKFIKVIGNHNEVNRMHTAEFVMELNKINYIISGGSDKTLRFYSKINYNEIQFCDLEPMKDWTYSAFERINNSNTKNEYQFMVCLGKEIVLYTYTSEKEFNISKWELPNMSCISSLEMEVVDETKDNKPKVFYTIIAGRNGVKAMEENIFETTNNKNDKKSFDIIEDNKTYRGLYKLNDKLIAMTSNEVLKGGENKIFIYNLSIKEKIQEINTYPFVDTNNGMTVFKNVFLCAYKKYSRNPENGIKIALIENDKIEELPGRYDTKNFEVYCFCPILESLKSGFFSLNSSKEQENTKETDFFLVAGFENKKREGKIQLFKLEREGGQESKVKGIKFLQDIDIEETEEILREDEKVKNKKPVKFKGFRGAITSIIQSKENFNILASCYDGKIYLLSEPNIKKYRDKYKN